MNELSYTPNLPDPVMFRAKFTCHCHYRYNKHLPTVNCTSELSRPLPPVSLRTVSSYC